MLTVQCSMISSVYLRKTKSPPSFNKMVLLRTQLTILWNLWMRFLENVSSLQTYGPSLTGSYATRAAKSAVYRDRPRTLNDLKTAVTAYIRNISQAGLQTVFANKIKWVQACINAHGHHFQRLFKHTVFHYSLYKWCICLPACLPTFVSSVSNWWSRKWISLKWEHTNWHWQQWGWDFSSETSSWNMWVLLVQLVPLFSVHRNK
jgi:hypothetical protein